MMQFNSDFASITSAGTRSLETIAVSSVLDDIYNLWDFFFTRVIDNLARNLWVCVCESLKDLKRQELSALLGLLVVFESNMFCYSHSKHLTII